MWPTAHPKTALVIKFVVDGPAMYATTVFVKTTMSFLQCRMVQPCNLTQLQWHNDSDTMARIIIYIWQHLRDSHCYNEIRIHVQWIEYMYICLAVVWVSFTLCKCFCHFTSHLHMLDGTALYTMSILRSFKAGTVHGMQHQNPHLPPTPWYVCHLAYNLWPLTSHYYPMNMTSSHSATVVHQQHTSVGKV